MDTAFLVEQLERLSFGLKRITVMVLDNASAYRAKRLQERRGFRQQSGLFVFSLPLISKHRRTRGASSYTSVSYRSIIATPKRSFTYCARPW
jgi:hypothetical protein